MSRRVECSVRLPHTVNFVDELTPMCKAKPAGVLGPEIWVKARPRGSCRA
ncbi:MAG: hypothetical protein V2A79_15030 [Planctomycetota bacterium]